MKLAECAFLADENIHPLVVAALRARGIAISNVGDEKLSGAADRVILQHASAARKVVLTHDSDFGALAIAQGEAVFGIVFLRPGHIDPAYTLATIEGLFEEQVPCEPPFLIVAARRTHGLHFRFRRLRAEPD